MPADDGSLEGLSIVDRNLVSFCGGTYAGSELKTYRFQAYTLAVIPGIAVGLASGYEIRDGGFPEHSQYEATTKEISALEHSQTDLGKTAAIARAANRQDLAQQSTVLNQRLVPLIAQKEKALPHGYHPNIEVAASVGGGILAGTLITAAFGRYIFRRNQRTITTINDRLKQKGSYGRGMNN